MVVRTPPVLHALVLAALLVGPRLARAQQAAPQPAIDAVELEDRLADIEDRLDRTEKRSLLNRVHFTADYRTILQAFIYRGPSADPWDLTDPTNPLSRRRVKAYSEEIWSHRLRLGMHAEPLPSLRLNARLVMFKHFGDSDSPPFVFDAASTRVPRDSGARFDQLWLDWFPTSWLAISVGRITDGNPQELKENLPFTHKTWGLQMVDGEYETINTTLDLTPLIASIHAISGFHLRVFYASWFNDNDQDLFGSFGFLNNGVGNQRIVGANLDLSFARIAGNLLQVGYYYVPKFRPQQVPIPDPAYNAAEDFRHAPLPLSDSTLYPSDMPDSLGDYQSVSSMVEFMDVGGSGLDWFLAGSVGKLNPNGQGVAYDLPNGTGDPSTAAGRTSTPFLFLASDGASNGLTGFVYTGLRYTLPIALGPKLGFEFNWGSRYHIHFSQQTDQLVNKLVTRGKAYDAYAILPINKYLFLRASYLLIDTDYQSGFFGPSPTMVGSTAPRQDQIIHNMQLTLNATM